MIICSQITSRFCRRDQEGTRQNTDAGPRSQGGVQNVFRPSRYLWFSEERRDVISSTRLAVHVHQTLVVLNQKRPNQTPNQFSSWCHVDHVESDEAVTVVGSETRDTRPEVRHVLARCEANHRGAAHLKTWSRVSPKCWGAPHCFSCLFHASGFDVATVLTSWSPTFEPGVKRDISATC